MSYLFILNIPLHPISAACVCLSVGHPLEHGNLLDADRAISLASGIGFLFFTLFFVDLEGVRYGVVRSSSNEQPVKKESTL